MRKQLKNIIWLVILFMRKQLKNIIWLVILFMRKQSHWLGCYTL